MADVLNPTAFAEADASNSSGTQPSFPENMPGKDLNNAARALQGAIKRWVNQICGTKVTAGTAAAYTVAYTQAPEALYTGQRFAIIAHIANSAAPSLNINGLGAKTIKKINSGVATDLSAGEIQANAILDLFYISSLNAFIWANPPPPSTALTDATTTVKGISELATRAEVQQGVATVPIAVTPDTIGGLLFKGSDVAGGTSISLGDGGYFVITGTGWTATSIVFANASSAFGRRALLRFAAAGGIITHNASTLVLPGGANITVEAGDTCELYLDAAGAYRVTNYQRSTGASGLTAATAAEIWAASNNAKGLTPASAAAAMNAVAVAFNASLTIDFSTGINFEVGTLTGNITTFAAAGITAAMVYRSGVIKFTQDATGGRTLNNAAATWKSINGEDIVLSTGANQIDYVYYTILSTTTVLLSLARNVA